MGRKWLRKIFRCGRKKHKVEQDPHSNPSTSMKSLAKMFQELECPICLNTCSPPIQTCENGHIICKECRKRISVCPSCRKGFNGTRNFFAENFISLYSQPCRFVQDGCEFLRWKGENMKPHEENCMFRPIDCIVCSTQLAYKTLLPHLKTLHKIGGRDQLPATITYHVEQPLMANRKWLPYCIRAFGNNYFVMFQVDRPNFWIWVWQQTIKAESTSTAGSYITSIIFENYDKNLSLSWIGPVHSIRTPETTIKKDGLCFVCPEVVMQHFKIEDYVTFSINIEKQNVKSVGDLSCLSLTEVSSRHQRSASVSRVDINGNCITPIVSSIQTSASDDKQDEDLDKLEILELIQEN